MKKLWWDLETYSETSIKSGTHAYAEKAEIMLWLWAADDGPVYCWDLTTGAPMPEALAAAIDSCDEYWGSNSGMFDNSVVKNAKPEIYVAMQRSKHRDLMVQALCHGLPGGLDKLCDIFKLPEDIAKQKRGKQLIQLFCKPRPKNQKLRRATRETHPAEWAEFIEYGKSDITSMRALHPKIPKWNYPNNAFELSLWHLDQEINQRGAFIDLELAQKAIEAVDVAQAGLAAQTREATNGDVAAATQRDKLLQHILAEYGVLLPDMRADTLERRLADPDLPDGVKDLIHIRLQASTSSVSKYKRIVKGISFDGYMRGLLQFSGASRTQRWAGRLLQPQNFLRPTLPQADIDAGVEAIKLGCVDLLFSNVMELTANCMRGVIISPPGKKLVVADLSNIEGRAAAWLAGEKWKLQAFRDFDAGTGPDLYKLAYARSSRINPEDVDKAQRQIGKVQELGLGYGGGVGAFLTFAATYGLDLDDMTDAVIDSIPSDIWQEALGFLEWAKKSKRPTFGLTDEVFCVCESLKRMWREANPRIAACWGELENAARQAIYKPGVAFPVGMVHFKRDGNWLRMMLPSGDCLAYPAPRVDDSGAISYAGVNQYSRQWSRIKTYGGKLFENLCQKIARNVMAHNMPSIEAAGYGICLTVHDELITYAPDTPEFGHEHLSTLLAQNKDWTKGLPLAAAGFEAYRYRKD
jgi:DNA polymerase bacteriophage-type